jgi:hypothetical protein
MEWKGNLTGIPRTVDEIARRLNNESNVEFIRWSFKNQLFEKVDIDYYYEVIDPLNRAYFNNEGKVKRSEKTKLVPIIVIKKIIRSSRILSMIAELTLKFVRKAESFSKSVHINNGFKVDNGSVIFIPCGLWDNDEYIESVLEYKEKGSKIAFLSYDLLPIVVPQFSGQWGDAMTAFTDKITSICDVVFSISEHTKRDLERHLIEYGLTVPKIVTIRLGDEFTEFSPVIPKDQIFIDSKISQTKEEFILCTGTLEARKNHTLLYYTYKLAKSRGIKLPKIIVAGRVGYRTENIISIIEEDPEVMDSILILKDVSDQELSWLYTNCRFTVYQSFYEGWGLPIAESVSRVVPCIASNTSSMVEVAPNFVKHFNPASSDEFLSAIIEYMDDNNLKAAKNKLKKYKPISWDFTYAQVIKELGSI